MLANAERVSTWMEHSKSALVYYDQAMLVPWQPPICYLVAYHTSNLTVASSPGFHVPGDEANLADSCNKDL